MQGWGHPEALPGLASPSLPQLRLVVVHSKTGLDLAGRQGPRADRCFPLSLPTLGLTHEAGKSERGSPLLCVPHLGQKSPVSRGAKGRGLVLPWNPPGY